MTERNTKVLLNVSVEEPIDIPGEKIKEASQT